MTDIPDEAVEQKAGKMTPEERIKAAAEALTRKPHETREAYAGRVLAAAYPEDFPPKPKWPSTESLKALRHCCDIYGDADEQAVEEALLADPIIKAAVAWRKRYSPMGGPTTGDLELHGRRNAQLALARAIDEAGL